MACSGKITPMQPNSAATTSDLSICFHYTPMSATRSPVRVRTSVRQIIGAVGASGNTNEVSSSVHDGCWLEVIRWQKSIARGQSAENPSSLQAQGGSRKTSSRRSGGTPFTSNRARKKRVKEALRESVLEKRVEKNRLNFN